MKRLIAAALLIACTGCTSAMMGTVEMPLMSREPLVDSDWDQLQAMPAAKDINHIIDEMQSNKKYSCHALDKFPITQLLPFINYYRPVHQYYSRGVSSDYFSTDYPTKADFGGGDTSGPLVQKDYEFARKMYMKRRLTGDFGTRMFLYIQGRLLAFTKDRPCKKQYYSAPKFLQSGTSFQNWFVDNQTMRLRDFRIMVLEHMLKNQRRTNYNSDRLDEQAKMLKQLLKSEEQGPMLKDLTKYNNDL